MDSPTSPSIAAPSASTAAASGWSAPGSAAPQPVRTLVAAGPLQGTAKPPGPLAGSPVDRLQPRALGSLLDGGFEVLRFRFGVILAVTATLVLPLYAVPALLGFGSVTSSLEQLDNTTPNQILFGGAGGIGNPWWNWLATAGGALSLALVGVGVGHLVSSWLMGRDPDAVETLRVVARRSPVAIAAWLIALLPKGVGVLACGVGLIFPMAALLALSPLVASESIGPLAAVRRCWRLSWARLGSLLGITVVSALVSFAVGGLLGAVGGVLASMVERASWAWVIGGAVAVAVQLLVIPLQAAWASLVYVDLRVRVEALDIELERSELFT